MMCNEACNMKMCLAQAERWTKNEFAIQAFIAVLLLLLLVLLLLLYT